ncbi:MAG TPA: bifunctional 4-hydroxy-2-oxoglutarate aldolase/2-dehydro-3-deoxy-phosphogluconate aldolase [Spirochaetia bacterium]|nr:bifunctional 4-hydroxy-2-oxoglutarate aldolase/2-dehydro-3-deoxy-phosphogluconate aldolase [Spirochaetia bacterium]
MTTGPAANKTDLDRQIGEYGVVPVIVLSDPAQAQPLGEALLAGGLPVAEITFRSDAALEGIRIMAREYPQMLLGAGTVLTLDQAKSAIDAGATFIVTPGFNPAIVDFCIDNKMPIYPGISGTGEIEAAMSRGIEVVKFFPAEALGGVPMIKALSGPYRKLKFMPTGGISLANLHDYLALPQVVACGGSWLVAKDALAAGDYGTIVTTVRDSMRAIYGCTVAGGSVEVETRYPERTKAYLARAGVDFGDSEGGIEMKGKTIILRG